MHPYLQSFVGGVLVGTAVWILLKGIGRVAGISGIAAEAISSPRTSLWRFAFLLGLIIGGAFFVKFFSIPTANVASGGALIAAGLLVGFGTVVAGGCTSGHGVCGLGRRSMRSLVATASFMGAGMVTVAILNALKAGA
ncbi:MAG: YeeE/YedE family protein [Burkholderiales bacterium]|nr:YeeE/YedE family protein [Burkholderiales bacterium]